MTRAGPETRLRAQIVKMLNALPQCYVVKYHGSMYGQAGVPDLLICLRGRFIAMEIKAPGGKVTPLQESNITQINNAGGAAYIVRSVEDAQQAVEG